MKRVKNAELEQEVLTSVGETNRSRVQYSRREVIFRQGEPAEALFYIESGQVQLSVLSGQGKEGVIGILGAGSFFGEGCLANEPVYIATASAISPATIVRINRQTMLRILDERPSVSKMFLDFLLSRNAQVQADLIDQLFNSTEKRLARTLLLLAHFGEEGEAEAPVKVNQELLAARIGTTRTRINFFLNKFRRLGLIEYNGNLKVHPSLVNVLLRD
jgi:CRP/FNR family transcriptional regulator, cyclic AMP receptor protein